MRPGETKEAVCARRLRTAPSGPFSRNRDDYDDAAPTPCGVDSFIVPRLGPGASHVIRARLFRLHHRHGAVRHHGQVLRGDILPRLWRRGLPAQEPQWVQYRQAIPTCPVVRALFYESCYSMILIASSRIFRAAFTSRSCNTPHDGHAHSRTLKSLTRGFL